MSEKPISPLRRRMIIPMLRYPCRHVRVVTEFKRAIAQSTQVRGTLAGINSCGFLPWRLSDPGPRCRGTVIQWAGTQPLHRTGPATSTRCSVVPRFRRYRGVAHAANRRRGPNCEHCCAGVARTKPHVFERHCGLGRNA
jgi:hypothetical protein